MLIYAVISIDVWDAMISMLNIEHKRKIKEAQTVYCKFVKHEFFVVAFNVNLFV